MVGNYVPGYRRLGDIQETQIFAWRPVKTNSGWRWLCNVIRVSEIVTDERLFSKSLDFLGFGSLTTEKITYKIKE